MAVRLGAATRSGLRSARPKPCELYDHDVPVAQRDAVAEAQTVGAVEVDVHVAR